MAVKARDDVTLATLTDVANVRRYYLLQASTLNPPAAPTANPAPAPWVTAEPTYTEGSTTSLYTVDLTVFTDGTFDYSTVSKSSSYEAAKSAFNKAVSATNTANAALAAVPPFVQQSTPSATVVGQLWFPLDSSGRMIGMKRATAKGTGGWVDYLWMAGKILVPGTVGTTEIGPEGVLAANIKASNELWAKLASFAKVTTGMLIAGNATITGEMIVNELIGKVLRGGLIDGGEIISRSTSALEAIRYSYNFSSSAIGATGSAFGGWSATETPQGGSAAAKVLTVSADDTHGRCVTVQAGTTANTVVTFKSATFLSDESAANANLEMGAYIRSTKPVSTLEIQVSLSSVEGGSFVVNRLSNLEANTWYYVAAMAPPAYAMTSGMLIKAYVSGASAQVSLASPAIKASWDSASNNAASLTMWTRSGSEPRLEIVDSAGALRVGLGTGRKTGAAGLSFFSDQGDAMTFTGDGLYGTKNEPNPDPYQIASWQGMVDTISPILIKTPPTTIPAGSYVDLWDIPYGLTLEEPPLLETYLSPAGDIVRAEIFAWNATTTKFNLRIYNSGQFQKDGVVAWVVVRPVRSFKLTTM